MREYIYFFFLLHLGYAHFGRVQVFQLELLQEGHLFVVLLPPAVHLLVFLLIVGYGLLHEGLVLLDVLFLVLVSKKQKANLSCQKFQFNNLESIEDRSFNR